MSAKLRTFLSQTWRAIRLFAHELWEIVCWLIVPVVFGYLCYASVTKKFELSILQICLAAIALSPWILRLLARYLSEFDISLKGVSGKTRETVKNKDEIEKPVTVNMVNVELRHLRPFGWRQFFDLLDDFLRAHGLNYPQKTAFGKLRISGLRCRSAALLAAFGRM